MRRLYPEEKDSDRLSSLADALAALANKVEPQPAAKIGKGLAAALENPQETDPERLSSLGKALAAVGNEMEPQPVAEIAKGLPQPWRIRRKPILTALRALARRWRRWANKMEPQAAAEIARRDVQWLAAALENPQVAAEIASGARDTDLNKLLSVGETLAALASKIEAQAAVGIVKGVAAALENPQVAAEIAS